MEKLLKNYPVRFETPVAWGEMDAFRHVNNIVYFRYFESARIKYFERMKMLEYMDRHGIGPILATTQCRFKIPLTYPDTVTVGARVSDVGEDRFVMEYIVVSHKHQKAAAVGDGVLVSFNYDEGAKTDLPEELKKRIAEIEGGE